MASLLDILALLDRWAEWKRMRAAPGRVDALEARVAALEGEVARRPAPELCPFCRTGELRLVEIVPEPGPFGVVGAKLEIWRCQDPACGRATERKRERR